MNIPKHSVPAPFQGPVQQKRNAGRRFGIWIAATCTAGGLIATALVSQGGMSSLKWLGATAFFALLFGYCLWIENRRLFSADDDGRE